MHEYDYERLDPLDKEYRKPSLIGDKNILYVTVYSRTPIEHYVSIKDEEEVPEKARVIR